MKQKRLIMRSAILLVLLAAIVYTLYTNFFVSKETAVLGNTAPNFVLEDLQGVKHTLSDYKGQGVFLNFWGTWCEPCKREMPAMNRLYEELKDKGIVVIAVNLGESSLAVQKFVDEMGLTFPVLLDKDGEVLEAYNINPIPTSVLIDKSGTVIQVVTGEQTEEQLRSHFGTLLQ
ncbi:thiol-disulfide oxidoreductase ResA [Bacillus sp. HMF5848]|uniref:thiol-disulfide oxidoreductase ResA n=1 Tax=Bacillus sp. HMF5848 TaxID=2495421 RepID=UPI0026BBEBCA